MTSDMINYYTQAKLKTKRMSAIVEYSFVS